MLYCVCIYACICVSMLYCVCIYACICVSMLYCVCIYACICVSMLYCVCIYACICVSMLGSTLAGLAFCATLSLTKLIIIIMLSNKAVDILPVTGLLVPDLFCRSSMIYGNLDCFAVIYCNFWT